MAVIIKEMRIRTVVEKRVVPEAELPEEILRKVEDRILDIQRRKNWLACRTATEKK